MNKKLFFIATVAIAALATFIFFKKQHPATLTDMPVVGIIVPLTHPSLEKIVKGFCSQLSKQLNNKCSFIVRDAHGDQHVQQPAIIDEMKYKQVDLIVPIGRLCTQMTVQKAPEIPTVALAASPDVITKGNLVTGIHDEIAPESICAFIKHIVPNINKYSIIATQSEKTLPEIEALRNHSMNAGITVQTIFVQTPSDIYLATHSVNSDSQAIFILKDHMVVSSVATIAQLAKERSIPLIASDEGSVLSGAACALGVEETSIGEAGAVYAAQILQGTSPKDIPVKPLSNLVIFINKHACKQQNLPTQLLESCAKSSNYRTINMSKA